MKGKIFAFLLFCIFSAGLFSQDMYKVEMLPFNTRAFDELSPVPYQNGLVFISNRRVSILNTNMDASRGTPVNNIWYTEQKENGKWISPSLFSGDLTSVVHEGPVAFNPRGTVVYFTRRQEGRRKDNKTLGIFMADKSGSRWIRIRPFPHNSAEYNIAHPTLSVDGTRLFFASDMPGGYGGMDIYMSQLENGLWSKPVNLGPSINSDKDEAFPVIHATGRLFFSSKGRGSAGGFDIFYSDMVNETWLNPVRLAEPFNSPFDDFAYVADPEFQTGYFTSNRELSDNIYRFRNLVPQFRTCNEIVPDNLCFDFWEETGHIDTLAFKVEWDFGDGTKRRGVEVYHCFKEFGEYEISLNVIDAITGKFQYREATYQLSVKREEQVVITAPETCFVNQDITLDGSFTNLPGIAIDEYYWDFGDGNKAMGNVQTHRFTRPGLYRVTLGITSKPDARDNVIQKCSYKLINVVER